jgi:hypothetical protein
LKYQTPIRRTRSPSLGSPDASTLR